MSEPRLLLGDCVERLRDLDAESVDAIVCDPPYGLGKEPPIADVLAAWLGDRTYTAAGGGFMGHTWDAFVPDLTVWRECFRVLKPGGHLLAFSGTRTVDLIGIGIRLAGFERRDLLAWLYGSGFPKSRDMGKAIDQVLGVEGTYGEPKTPRHAEYLNSGYGTGKHEGWDRPWMDDAEAVERTAREYLPGSAQASEWRGWGTALKPALEPIVLARKPVAGTIAANVLAHGVGALNIDRCRIAFRDDADESESKDKNRHADFGTGARENHVYGSDDRARADQGNYDAPGRWPSNVLLGHSDACVLVGHREIAADGHWPGARPAGSELAGASGHVGQDGLDERHAEGETVEEWECGPGCPVGILDAQTSDGDVGGASRFFYSAKASAAERNAGLEEFEAQFAPTMGNGIGGKEHDPETATRKRNVHPTVKPIALMRWLVRLVVRPGAVVCDPFLGSGTTGVACALEGVEFVGIEREPEYLAIAAARIRFWSEHGDEALRVVADREVAESRRRAVEDAGQLDLFATGGDA